MASPQPPNQRRGNAVVGSLVRGDRTVWWWKKGQTEFEFSAIREG
jgi:hypothetical protein